MTNYLKKEFYQLIKNDYATFDFIQETAPDGVWYWDMENPENNWINPRFLKVLGYNPEEMAAEKSWKQIIHPDDLRKLPGDFLKSSHQGSLDDEKTIRCIHKNGSNVQMSCRRKLIHDEKGGVNRMLVCHDENLHLKESEKRYKKLLNSISDSIYVIDTHWNYIMVNDVAVRHIGLPKSKILNSSVIEVFPDLKKTEFYKLFRQVMEEREADALESRYKYADGRVGWFDVRVYPVEEGILCISKEITEQKQAQIALKKNKERFELMLKNSTDVFVELTGDGQQKYISPVVEKYTGYKPEELQRSFTEVIHPDDLERVKKHWEEVIARPDRIHREEYRHIHKTKGYVWVEACLQSFLDNPRIQSVICSVRDISERKKAEELIKESEEHYKTLSNAASEMLALENLDDIYDYITQVFSRQFPGTVCLFVTVDEAHYSTKVKGISGLNNTLLKKVMDISKYNLIGSEFNLLPSHYVHYKTGRLTLFDGGLTRFADTEFPAWAAKSIEKLLGINKIYAIGINKDNKLYGILHFFTRNKADLTNHQYIETFIKQAGIVIDRKIMEQKLKESEKRLSEANATKDKFFSIIAHDLRHPFNILLGFSEMILEQINNEEFDKVKETGEIIRQSSQQGYVLLNNLLEWSRSQQGTLGFHPEYQNLQERVRKVTALLSNMAEKKNIAINNDFKPEEMFYADANMFDTILRNLLSNALKFTPKGGKVDIIAKHLKDKLEMKIVDTGVGIKPEEKKKLFKLEENVSARGTEGEEGTGLGLILCKDFVEQHGGQLGLESTPGVGTTFWFTLPDQV